MGQYIYDYENLSFKMTIDDYWHKIYNGQPRENLYGCYTLVLDWVKKVNKDKYILDIGINHGIFSLPCSLMGYKIIGFEPVLSNYNSANYNMKSNNCENYRFYNYAVSNFNGETDIFVPECPDNASFSQSAAIANMKNKEFIVEKVQVIKFDDWIKEHPEYSNIGFIKIDTQGAEYSIIEGMSEFLKNSKDLYLIAEYEAHLNKFGHSYDELHNLILSFGFEYKGDITGGDRLYYKN